MQASVIWSPPTGTLGVIVAEAEGRARALERHERELLIQAKNSHAPSLAAALRGTSVAVLAEVKRRSPSKGAIAEGLDAGEQATAYAAGGAAAISVLTEPTHFGGSNEDLTSVRSAVTVPALKKDFHVLPIQLLEARALGASAALLIARALAPNRLSEMIRTGISLGIELLLEVRDEAELERVLAAGATMIGVNNRDLETLQIDPATACRLIPLIPRGLIAVAESGIGTVADVVRYAVCGTDAVLVGSTLSSSADPIAATRALVGVRRRIRG